MANCCMTTYKCVGDKKELKELWRMLEKNRKRKRARVKNGYGTMWLGCIIDTMGLDWQGLSFLNGI